MFVRKTPLVLLRRCVTDRVALAVAAVYLANLFLMISTMLGYRLAKVRFDEVGFCDYALMRRSVAYLLPALSLGLTLALPWHVASAKQRNDRRNEWSAFLASSFAITTVTLLVAAVPTFLFPAAAARLLWGDAARAYLVFPLFAMLTGTLSVMLCYGYCRGRLWMGTAGILQAALLGFAPLLMLSACTTITTAFSLAGIGMLIVSLAFFGTILRGMPGPRDIFAHGRGLLRYGLPRLPGNMCLAALLYMPVLLASRANDPEMTGQVAYALSLITLMQAPVAPAGVLLLPHATIMLMRGERARLRRRTILLVASTLLLTLGMVALVLLATEWLLTLHLGTYDTRLPTAVRVMILAAVPYNLHVCLRGIVDAGTDRALNARAAYFALGTCLLAAGIDHFVFDGRHGVFAPFLVGMTVMAIFTCAHTYGILAPRGSDEKELQTSAAETCRPLSSPGTAETQFTDAA